MTAEEIYRKYRIKYLEDKITLKETVLAAMEEYAREFSAEHMPVNEDEIISFGMYLTGYDERMVRQMYEDWRKQTK